MTPEKIAEAVDVRAKLIILLIEQVLLETVDDRVDEVILLPLQTITRLRKIQKLRHDLKVNFADEGVILDMIEQMEATRRELAELRTRFNS